MRKKEKPKKDDPVLVEDEVREKHREVDENQDPITGEPGSHPVGVAAGGSAGAAAGTSIGTAVGGPIGGLIGAAAGAIAGGLAGKGVAEAANPTEEEKYWREYFKTRPYFKRGLEYESYAPGYKFGWESAIRPEFRGKKFEEVESQLRTEWPNYYSTEEFSEHREATKDAYERVQGRFTPPLKKR